MGLLKQNGKKYKAFLKTFPIYVEEDFSLNYLGPASLLSVPALTGGEVN